MRVSCESFFQQSKTGEDLLVMGGNYTWRWEAGGGRWVWMDMLRKLETQKFGEGGPEGW